jgi:DNA-directed RNA polymerase subunit omega
MLPNPDILNDYPYGKFVLANLAAKRAKQLGEGAPALVHIDSKHPLTIALAEIAAGKIKPVLPDGLGVIDQGNDINVFGEDAVTDRGMLLPALDETETSLIADVEALVEEDPEDILGGDDLSSLSDLVGEDEETEVGSDEDEISLSDLAESESDGDDSNDSDA